MKALAQLGMDMCARDNSGQTALHAAAGQGHTETVRVSVQLAADVRAQDNNGHT
eukprot:CAMPEP_0114253762 /NCGR_PEP_ID=MMETSP0058-20121206/16584_1 /TAXON_ID=36894 /ORGANISM="Pyramimonas parkeae, CCMP726" /LENGTH=53 /DNA_ID=CAMNT_0001367867 /DNA_START=44 /DNA_END=202 /DNA_ORIENTATION=+